MKRVLLSFCFVLVCSILWATGPFTVSRTLAWTSQDENSEADLYFDGAIYVSDHPSLPMFSERFQLDAPGTIAVTLKNEVYEPLTKKAHADDQFIREDITIKTSVDLDRRQAFGSVWFIPIRKNPLTGSLEKLVSYDLTIRHQSESIVTPILRNGPFDSNLSTGDLYKISIPESGIYKIDANFLSSQLGVDAASVDPRKIKIYGNAGGLLPEPNNNFRYEDVQENAIFVAGEGDGSFDSNDYILFYAHGPSIWTYNTATSMFSTRNHYYDYNYHYFIKIDNSGPDGKRIAEQASLANPTYVSEGIDGLAHHEVDEINLLDDYINAFGTGKLWYGETFKFTNDRDFNFTFPNLQTNQDIRFEASVAGRSLSAANHIMSASANGNNISVQNLGSVTGDTEQTYAQIRTMTGAFQSPTNDVTISMSYNQPTSNAEAWLDYITLNARLSLVYNGTALTFRDKMSVGQSITSFTIAGVNSNVLVWDISDPVNVRHQLGQLNGSALQFGAETFGLKTFVAFEGSDFPAPGFVGSVANQNLHAMAVPNLVILHTPEMAASAAQLANHRSNFSGISVALVELEQVYNEFSSGTADITAIRDFAKHLYDQGPDFKYLLLFGDASFDFRNIKGNETNYNIIPTYETDRSNHPISGYPSDDYFGLLDPNEGFIASGALDIGIGRIPARTPLEASQVVEKIIRYDTDPQMLGSWKNRLLFNADDQDNNLHLNDEDNIAQTAANNYPVFNLEKNYFDAYPQVTTPGGNRYPDASEAIDNSIFKGVMVVNYMGHGGSNGWAQERVLTNDMIESWENTHKLPLFVTATCTFGPYDEPSITSAGELLVLKPNSGAIALYTTVRAVFASSNRELTEAVFEHLFEEVNGEIPTIGEILRLSKNSPGSGLTENTRKFTLLGDPSMQLSHPKYNVVTTEINDMPVTGNDTIMALQEVTVKGFIEAPGGGILTDFNGTILPTVYDKPQTQFTLGNDSDSDPRGFATQRNIIFKGVATVANGEFTFTFTMPSDINFTFGNGKISYYAHDGVSEDANGYYNGVIIGGSDSTAPIDDEDPVVKIFMNNEEFAFGGITDENPILLVKLSDDRGINTVGNGIGHDITAILDEDPQQSYILNDFYESELDNSRQGMVRFPLTNLEDGRHSISVKAWDIANNSGEDYTEFVVAQSAELALERVLNYPNPFTTNTSFQFEHNFPGQTLHVQVQIFTVSGNLIKTIEEDIFSDGYRISSLTWDGTDEYGDRIGRGVYVYKVSVASIEEQEVKAAESKFEKLVILR